MCKKIKVKFMRTIDLVLFAMSLFTTNVLLVSLLVIAAVCMILGLMGVH